MAWVPPGVEINNPEHWPLAREEVNHVGDPVVVKGTGVPLEWGNGWTDWSRPWDEYVKGSALPPPSPGPAPSASAS